MRGTFAVQVEGLVIGTAETFVHRLRLLHGIAV